jgi:hypothetical protein
VAGLLPGAELGVALSGISAPHGEDTAYNLGALVGSVIGLAADATTAAGGAVLTALGVPTGGATAAVGVPAMAIATAAATGHAANATAALANLTKGGGGATSKAAGGAARGGAGVVRVGQAGEAAVRSVADIGPKVPITVAGRARIPDGLNLETRVLSEVKNVGSLSYTQQLRDFAAHASANGLRFDLWVRPTTQLSGPLAQEVANGAINLRYIP